MKIQASNIRTGNVFEYEGRLWVCGRTQITKPGKGGAYIQIEMKDIRSGTKSNVRFSTGDNIEKVHLENQKMQYLYPEGDNLVFMNQDNYEQVSITSDMLGDMVPFLQDSMICEVQFYEGAALSVELPEMVTLTIAEADPVVKGQTASSSYKPAMLENGVKIMVPPFISAGERVVVRVADAEYIERARS